MTIPAVNGALISIDMVGNATYQNTGLTQRAAATDFLQTDKGSKLFHKTATGFRVDHVKPGTAWPRGEASQQRARITGNQSWHRNDLQQSNDLMVKTVKMFEFPGGPHGNKQTRTFQNARR